MIREPDVRALVTAFGVHVREHLRTAEPDRDRVLEVLNALAITSAVVLAGAAGGDGEARAFFLAALENQLAGLVADLDLGDRAQSSSLAH